MKTSVKILLISVLAVVIFAAATAAVLGLSSSPLLTALIL